MYTFGLFAFNHRFYYFGKNRGRRTSPWLLSSDRIPVKKLKELRIPQNVDDGFMIISTGWGRIRINWLNDGVCEQKGDKFFALLLNRFIPVNRTKDWCYRTLL